MSATADGVARRYAAARGDAALLQAALHVEQVCALAYGAARALPFAARFERHEREHAAAFETLLEALTVPVREHAGAADLDALAPGLRRAGADAAAAQLLALEEAAIAGHQLLGRRLEALDALRTVASASAGAAQHAVVLRSRLGRHALTRAFENGA